MRCLRALLAFAIVCASAAFGQTAKSTPSETTKSTPSETTKSTPSERAKPTPSQKAKSTSSPTAKATPSQKAKPTSSPTAKRTPSQKAKSTPSPTVTPTPSQAARSTGSPMPVEVSALKPEDIRDFDGNPPEVQKLLRTALELTERKLGYVYGSADPAQGGMDCSGTIYFLLQAVGIKDVPRSASAQYVWVRKSNTFHPVVSNRLDSFELDALRPGDLLFWIGTYSVNIDPPVTHSMIYVGKARTDGRPIMVGASDGRTYRGEKKFGVSVFDFVLPKPKAENPASRFIGYAKIPL
jgi:cell wall-associated NlpC family hydrolase